MNSHDGHRERLKKRYSENGLDSFNEINILELLLFYCIPRKDTNETAHALLNEYKTLNNVFNAPVEDLMRIEGVGRETAQFICLLRDISRYTSIQKNTKIKSIRSVKDAADYFSSFYMFKSEERLYMLCLDARKNVIANCLIAEGTVLSVEVSMRKIAEIALSKKAVSVILSHNHPGGTASPSHEDINLTSHVKEALHGIDITLDDHIIISENGYFSFLENGYL